MPASQPNAFSLLLGVCGDAHVNVFKLPVHVASPVYSFSPHTSRLTDMTFNPNGTLLELKRCFLHVFVHHMFSLSLSLICFWLYLCICLFLFDHLRSSLQHSLSFSQNAWQCFRLQFPTFWVALCVSMRLQCAVLFTLSSLLAVVHSPLGKVVATCSAKGGLVLSRPDGVTLHSLASESSLVFCYLLFSCLLILRTE